MKRPTHVIRLLRTHACGDVSLPRGSRLPCRYCEATRAASFVLYDTLYVIRNTFGENFKVVRTLDGGKP